MKGYSQCGQDLAICDFFCRYPPEAKFFVDCGAYDGIRFSNTRLFFEQGWSGLCIEPCQKNFDKLERLYRGTSVITVKAAVADVEGERQLNIATIPGAEEWGSDVSSLSDDTIRRWPNYIWEKETTRVTTLDRILKDCRIETIDFISIDVEGGEMAVLRGLDLSRYHPRLIVTEYSNPEERSAIMSHLKSFGYFCWMDNHQDLFLVKGRRLDYLPIMIGYSFRRH